MFNNCSSCCKLKRKKKKRECYMLYLLSCTILRLIFRDFWLLVRLGKGFTWSLVIDNLLWIILLYYNYIEEIRWLERTYTCTCLCIFQRKLKTRSFYRTLIEYHRVYLDVPIYIYIRPGVLSVIGKSYEGKCTNFQSLQIIQCQSWFISVFWG